MADSTSDTPQENASINDQLQGQSQEIISSDSQGQGAGADRPEWLPKEFETVEAWRADYDAKNAKAALGEAGKKEALKEAPVVEEGDHKEGAPLEGEALTARITEVKASLAKAGGFYADPRYEAAALEFETTGEVSEATIKATAEAFKVPEDMVKAFLDDRKAERAGQSSKAEAEAAPIVAQLTAVAGTAEDYKAFMTWGKENLSDVERNAYDKAIEADPNAAEMVLRTLVGKWKAAGNGPGPRDITTETTLKGTVGTQGYASRQEQQAAMRDARYGKDPAYTHEVERKTAATTSF